MANPDKSFGNSYRAIWVSRAADKRTAPGPLHKAPQCLLSGRSGAMPMAVATRELYSSPNGDRWSLARDIHSRRVFIRHEPNVPSGGVTGQMDLGAFLG